MEKETKMNRHSADMDNAESVLRKITLKKWIVENATDERLTKLIEIFQNELNQRKSQEA